MFFVPMWSAEEERIGFQKCTAAGYRLRGIAEQIGLCGLLSFFIVPVYLATKWLRGHFEDSRLWWLMALPFVCVIISKFLMAIVWTLADRKGFSYDYERRVSSWNDNGKRASFSYEDWKADNPADCDSGEPFDPEGE